MPPEVTTGRVTTGVGGGEVGGGDVVATGGGAVDGGVVVEGAEDVGAEVPGVPPIGADGGVDVVDVEVGGTDGRSDGVAALTPGCSLATTAPIKAVAPVAMRTAERVSRLRWALARWRLSAE